MQAPRGPLPRLLEPLQYWPRTLRLIWAAAPGWTVAWLLLLVLQGLLPVVPVYLTRPIINGLVEAVQAGGAWPAIEPLLWLGALMFGAMGLIAAVQSLIGWVRTAQAELVQDHISALIHKQSAAVDLAFYEMPEYFDQLDRARSEANSRSLALLENGGSLIQNGITLVAMGALLIPFGLWLPVLLLLSTLPALLVVLATDRRYHEWWARVAPERRRVQYYDMVLTMSHFVAESRLFGLSSHFQAAFQALRRRLRGERLGLMRVQIMAQLGASLAAMVVAGATLAWMVWRTLQGQLTPGDLALFYQAFQRGEGLMRSLLSNAGQIYSNSLFLGNLFGFLALQPTVVDPPAPVAAPARLHQGIRFRGVTFQYPGSARPVFEQFDLTIPAGKVVAIVGANGAGKSTLIKLLCRFYDPAAGSIEFDGIDIRQLRLAELRRNISVLFQFPITYQATAAENIAMGDLTAAHDLPALEAAARAAGAHEIIAGLPQGYATPLGKWFTNGVELSGGEWQRIATARAFLRQAQVIALDEPTSFMDSWAEADWFERFRTLAHQRTGLIITHRFTIAMRADIIHVMDKGRIVESGTHHELVARGGLYAQSWASQMQASLSEKASPLDDTMLVAAVPAPVHPSDLPSARESLR